jgi:hypothetical protein
VKERIGKRLAFKLVPQTLEDITNAAEWVGEGGHVVVDSVQGVMQGAANMNRGDAVEQAMRHIVALAHRTGAAFDIISEIGKPSNGAARSTSQSTVRPSVRTAMRFMWCAARKEPRSAWSAWTSGMDQSRTSRSCCQSRTTFLSCRRGK